MFSLYPTKNMTSGEGGMVSCATDEVARMVQLLRNQGMERRYENEIVGFNCRMTDVHAAIGRVQLGKLAGWTEQRQENAAFLDANLDGVVVPPVADGATHVYHQYTIRVPEDRDGFAARPARRARHRHAASTTRSRTTGCRRSGSPSTCPRPSAPPARCSRCRCTRR